MKKIGIILLGIIFSVAASASYTWAQRVQTKTEQAVQPHVHKLSRGIVNVGTAPLEVPKQMIKKAQEGNGPAGEFAGYLTGLFTGIGWTVCRFGSGIVDVVSAPFPGNEEGLREPEFISDEKILE